MNIFAPRVSALEKLMFTKHLSILIKAGIPLIESLETLAEDIKSESFKKVLKSVIKDVNNGKSLYDAFARHPSIFDAFYISLIKISEESGTLDSNLNFLSTQLGKDFALKQKIKGAMMYPSIVMTLGLGIGGFISIFILPQMVDFFDSFQVELPLATKILLVIANVMKSYGILIFGGLIVGIVLFQMLINTKLFKPIWHRVLLKFPLIGKLTIYGQSSRFCRNFGTLIASGVPIPLSLETAANTLTNLTFQRHFLSAEEALTKGKNISDYLLAKNYKEISPLLVKMLKVGERTGNLEEVMTYLSEFYEEEIDGLTKDLSNVLEPVMLVGIGLSVGFVALAIIGPIYKLTGSVY